jgi:hypothetical protein
MSWSAPSGSGSEAGDVHSPSGQGEVGDPWAIDDDETGTGFVAPVSAEIVDPWDIGSDSEMPANEVVGSGALLGVQEHGGHPPPPSPLVPPEAPLNDTMAHSKCPPSTSSHLVAHSPSRSRSRSTERGSPIRVDTHCLPNTRPMTQPPGLYGCSWWSTPLFHAVGARWAKMPAKLARPLIVESICGGTASEIYILKAPIFPEPPCH